MANKDKIVNIPARFSGQWIAWNNNHTRVIAHDLDMAEAEKKAKDTGEKYWLAKVPSDKEYYGGAATLR